VVTVVDIEILTQNQLVQQLVTASTISTIALHAYQHMSNSNLGIKNIFNLMLISLLFSCLDINVTNTIIQMDVDQQSTYTEDLGINYPSNLYIISISSFK
jgi:anaerobic C4-dicarboxylate transporter